ncbi:hypothetical protein BO71DRAFT_48910 [Aspergillus ellipticus CBS 707.79]|uniref:Uncharacterized protein n=1 Tax=Aspergillus ellipticus CBS 707.79 TaxID=1448320 RepID=A0A319D1U9_9EURO|nr:hypothetical protein BO71DRAFT_48910 [Aspergillus ellipticus CBS 707.79]
MEYGVEGGDGLSVGDCCWVGTGGLWSISLVWDVLGNAVGLLLVANYSGVRFQSLLYTWEGSLLGKVWPVEIKIKRFIRRMHSMKTASVQHNPHRRSSMYIKNSVIRT